MNDMLANYVEDFKDHLILFNESLMKMETSNDNPELINDLFRVAHTIKGNSAVMNFVNIKTVMHEMEDILHEVRGGKRELTDKLIELLYDCHDLLEDCLELIVDNESDESLVIHNVMNKIDEVKKIKEDKIVHCEEEQINVFSLNNDEEDILNGLIGNGNKAVNLEISLNDDVQMKTVRVWMLFDSMDTLGEIFMSTPKRPTDSDLENDDFQIDESIINAILIVPVDTNIKDIEELFKKELYVFDASVSKYESMMTKDVIIETFENKYKLLKTNIIDLLDLKVIKTENEIILSILIQLKDMNIVNVNKTNRNILNDLYNYFSLISEKNENPSEATIDRILALLSGVYEFTVHPDLDSNVLLEEAVIENLDVFVAENLDKVKRVGELLIDKKKISSDDLSELLDKQKTVYSNKKLGSILIEDKKVKKEDVETALKRQSTLKNISDKKKNNGFLRVAAGKVDNLGNMLGELLILNSQLEEHTMQEMGPNSSSMTVISRMSKILKNIQELSMSLRMVEIKPTLHKLTRICRDTANELDKHVSVLLEGENTEIDRSVADKILDPLMHLVRNAVSHGIEDKDTRLKSGKSEEGHIGIKAYNKRGSVYIEVSDDGKGIDPNVILNKAISNSLADHSKKYTEEEIIKFIFNPGFSTQEEVNSVAGRGVGMNVVESEITRMGGKIDINNRLGEGCTFILRIPMNLAVLNGTLIEIDEGRFVIPTLYIKEFFILKEDDWISIQNDNRAIKVRNEIIPLVTTGRLFDTYNKLDKTSINQVIIMEMDKKLIALPVKRIIDRREIVAKPLSSEFANIKLYSGASILGDGRVTMIFDIEEIFRIQGNESI